MTKLSENETYSDEGPQCPHCGAQFTADEPHYFDEWNYTEDTCGECGKRFKVELYTSTSWTCTKMDEPEPA